MVGPAHVLAVGLLAFGVTGCSLLDLLLGQGPFDPDASFPPFPTAEATFTTGTATLKIGEETIVLDEVEGSTSFGTTNVTWENDEGWYLIFTAYSDAEFGGFGSNGYLTLSRIADNEHWTVVDPTRCLTTTESEGVSGVRGSATCRDLLWSDWFSSYSGDAFPKPIPSEPAFDAEITFEAR